MDIGELVKLPDGSIKTIVAVQNTRHGGHRYFGFRLAGSKQVGKFNIGCKIGSRSSKQLYWVRADLVQPTFSEHIRTGKRGRPKRKWGGKRT